MRELGPTLLIVDHDFSWRELLGDFFKMYSYGVSFASSGKEALLALRHEPDLVILDPGLSGMSGIELLRMIQEIEEHRRPLVLLCSSGRIPADLGTLAQSELLKPIALPRLLLEVEQLLSKKAKKS